MLPLILSSLIFLVSLGLILTERLNRTIAGMLGAVLMVVLGMAFNFYGEDQAVAAIDFNTLGLLLGMMILIALLEPTGFFQYLAVWVGRISRGRPVLLLALLGLLNTVLSMFLDNVTTVILIAAITLVICENLGASPPARYLISKGILLQSRRHPPPWVGESPPTGLNPPPPPTFPFFGNFSHPQAWPNKWPGGGKHPGLPLAAP